MEVVFMVAKKNNSVKQRIIQLIQKIGHKPFTATELRLEAKIRGKDVNYNTLLSVLDELELKGILKKTPKFYQYELTGDNK